MKYNKAEKFIWLIFTIIGIAFIMIGSIVCASVFRYQGKVDTEGTITQIDTYRGDRGRRSYDVMVAYTVDGKDYESKLNGYSSSFYEGKKIDIYYDEENPRMIGIKKLDLLYLIFPGVGSIFAIIGVSGLIVLKRKATTEKKIRENGEMVYAQYVDIIYNRMYTVNGKHPYNIVCEWINPEDGKRYRLKSKNIWVNPENIIKEKDVKNFAVYYDPKNLKKYVIDVDWLVNEVVDLS